MRGVIFLLALLYVLSPVDLIPDVIPVVGWTDDLLALLIGAGALMVPSGNDRR
jgi:uncharacterized membrane protein YkvA (DUF1232 family)